MRPHALRDELILRNPKRKWPHDFLRALFRSLPDEGARKRLPKWVTMARSFHFASSFVGDLYLYSLEILNYMWRLIAQIAYS